MDFLQNLHIPYALLAGFACNVLRASSHANCGTLPLNFRLVEADHQSPLPMFLFPHALETTIAHHWG